MTWHTESSFTPDAIDRQMNASETFSWLTGSEMGGRIRAFDWRRTPLGPIERLARRTRVHPRCLSDGAISHGHLLGVGRLAPL
jgi:hypothetical protein